MLLLTISSLITLLPTQAPQATELRTSVAVRDVCAWPNLTLTPAGEILAVIHNRPAHGQMPGDVDCWASRDGEKWELRGRPAPNDPETIRMNVAAGMARDGAVVVLCSGWTNIQVSGVEKQAPFRDAIIRAWVCRSTDAGRTWAHTTEFPAPEAGWTEYVPFGDIWPASDGSLRTSCYHARFVDQSKGSKVKEMRSWHFRSDDDGRTWRAVNIIGPKHNETDLFPLGGKSWLAAARIDAMELFRSDDDGQTWQPPIRVTNRNEINGHLCRLQDGRLLLSYGSRIKDQFGVLAKISSDAGRTWSEPIRLARSLDWDCGYPSSVQLADGAIVTAYYSKAAPDVPQYHMGIALWRLSARR